MGTAELEGNRLIIYSHIITYGNAATTELDRNDAGRNRNHVE